MGDRSVSTLASTATFSYTVDVHAVGALSDGKVTGTINVTNPNAAPVLIKDVTDELSDTTATCTLLDVGRPRSGTHDFPYVCVNVDLSGKVPNGLANKATVKWEDQTVGGSELGGRFDDFKTGVIIFGPGDTVDECTDVVDNMVGQAPVQLGETSAPPAPTRRHFRPSRDGARPPRQLHVVRQHCDVHHGRHANRRQRHRDRGGLRSGDGRPDDRLLAEQERPGPDQGPLPERALWRAGGLPSRVQPPSGGIPPLKSARSGT